MPEPFDYDWIVIGSGFGGSVSALRLAQKGYSVLVLEQGRRFRDEGFASSAWDARRLLWAPRLGLRGIMQMTPFKHVTVLSGVGVGGGSLVYANTMYVPRTDSFYRHPQWESLADWREELAPHYATAQRMFGVTKYPHEGASERLMRGIAEDLGDPDAYAKTPVAVYFGQPGVEHPDPYFDGAGPPRAGCQMVGRCMLGCPHNAKNTLEKNYLWFAERAGVRIEPDRTVVDLRPLGDGGGYEVSDMRSGAVPRRGARKLRARGVVVAAGALGTNRLLRACKERGSLPRLSDRLGWMVRTNSEAITAATADARDADYSFGIGITSSVFPDDETHFTNNNYGTTGNALALNFGPLTGGRNRARRALAFFAALARDPARWLGPRRVRDWSRRTVIFTVMQSTDTALRLVPTRRGHGINTVQDDDTPLEPYLPIANRVAELAARRMGGVPQSSVADSLTGTPTTAHFLGGAVIGASPETGVVDAGQRVFGYDDLLICDGSVVPANVGVNPSLTIVALAERAIAQLPAA